MKINHFRGIHFNIVLVLLIGFLFGNVMAGKAQSSKQWIDPVNISRSGLGTNPHLVVDKKGVLHAIWEDVNKEFYYSKSIDAGTSWSKVTQVRYPFEVGFPIQFLVDNEGIINVFWVNGDNELIFNRVIPDELDKPYSWDRSYRLSRYVLNFHVDMAAYGALHASYITFRNPGGVYIRSSLGLGREWDEARLLNESSYFGSIKIADAHVRVSVSDDPENRLVQVVWDNRPEKRVYTTSSPDGGKTWLETKEFKGPRDTGGFGTPYNSEVGIVSSNQVLFMWQVGEPGASQCGVYAQWSLDGGATWGETETILDNRSPCPQEINFVSQNENRSVILFSTIGIPSIVAWNGDSKEWSDVQPQDEFSYFSNPLTFDPILLGCQKFVASADFLYQIACDEGSGKDIWLTSRTISNWETWFPPSPIWRLPSPLVSTSNIISSVEYVADQKNIHSVWVESPVSNSLGDDSIFYARWKDDSWSAPQRIIFGLNGKPLEMVLSTNGKDRLILFWVDNETGDLIFSWANSERAYSAVEWASPEIIPQNSGIASSPDMMVDGAGRIAVVYAVPYNEGRGIYLVATTDNGITWSPPSMVFDAVSAGWQSVDSPEITLSADGTLHLLFTKYSVTSNEPVGLFYSQSSDGGATWTPAEEVSTHSVLWSDIVSYGNGIIHRAWQEVANGVVSNLDQVSNDFGKSWLKPVNITQITNFPMPVSLVFNGTDNLHFIYLQEDESPTFLKEYSLSIQDSTWTGSEWQEQPFQEFLIRGEDARFGVVGGLTIEGQLDVAIYSSYRELGGDVTNSIINSGRSVTLSLANSTPDSGSAVIPSAPPSITETVVAVIPASPQPELGEGLQAPLSSPSRSLIRVSLFVVIILILAVVFLRRAAKNR